jgi:hypothetical protein
VTDPSSDDTGTGEDAATRDEYTGEIELPPGAEPVEVRAPVAERARLASWALGIALVALAVSFFVGWGFPLGLAAIVVAVIALRRPWERRSVAVWALVLGVLSVVYSAGWLVYAALESAAA